MMPQRERTDVGHKRYWPSGMNIKKFSLSDLACFLSKIPRPSQD